MGLATAGGPGFCGGSARSMGPSPIINNNSMTQVRVFHIGTVSFLGDKGSTTPALNPTTTPLPIQAGGGKTSTSVSTP